MLTHGSFSWVNPEALLLTWEGGQQRNASPPGPIGVRPHRYAAAEDETETLRPEGERLLLVFHVDGDSFDRAKHGSP